MVLAYAYFFCDPSVFYPIFDDENADKGLINLLLSTMTLGVKS